MPKKYLANITDEQLIAYACEWMANQAETGNGSVSALDRRETKERMIRQKMDISRFPEEKELIPHDIEYVRRMREIAQRFGKR